MHFHRPPKGYFVKPTREQIAKEQQRAERKGQQKQGSNARLTSGAVGYRIDNYPAPAHNMRKRYVKGVS